MTNIIVQVNNPAHMKVTDASSILVNVNKDKVLVYVDNELKFMGEAKIVEVVAHKMKTVINGE